MKAFTRQLKKALDELIRVGVIKAYWISMPPKGQSEDKRLYIWKNQLPTKLEPIPKGNGHFQSTETYYLSMAKADAAIDEC